MVDTTKWNELGRAKNQRVCEAFDEIIDGGGSSTENLTADARPRALADAVLAEVVALNRAGKWREARDHFDPAHGPFIPHMEETELGISQAVILGPESFLIRRGSSYDEGPVLHLDGDTVTTLPGVSGFAISRNRKWLALATTEGVTVAAGFKGKVLRTIAWPEGEAIRPTSFSISDDGERFVLASDAAGVWLAREGEWTKLVPREGTGDDADQVPDVIHAAISPDGKRVAYGWQDSPGHYVDAIEGKTLERYGVVGTVRDTPYHLLFTADSQRLLANTRYMQGGCTVSPTVESIRGLEEYDDLPEGTPQTDEYLRAYGMTILPGDIVWIGGAGWSHAAPMDGGKPAFTQFLGSTLDAFDYDPVSKRAIVGGTAGMLHVIDPATPAPKGCERGYKPRKELYRWIFWDTLDAPIRW